jgi:hypothetical protein
VAVWQRKDSVHDPDSFYLFDPNFGVFSYSKEGLQKAFEMLFSMADGNTPRYASDASADAQEMDYVIFGNSSGQPQVVTATPQRPQVESKQPQPKPGPQPQNKVVTAQPSVPKVTPSPQTTVSPTETPVVNAFSNPSFSVPKPGTNFPTVVQTPTQPVSGGALSKKLEGVLNDSTKYPDVTGKMIDGRKVPSYEGGSVKLDQATVAEILKVMEYPLLTGNKRAGEVLARSQVNTIIATLKKAGK